MFSRLWAKFPKIEKSASFFTLAIWLQRLFYYTTIIVPRSKSLVGNLITLFSFSTQPLIFYVFLLQKYFRVVVSY